MAIAPLFHTTLMGRELPRGQRWIDNTDEDDVRVDPGMTQAAYLGWVRDGADDPAELDWDGVGHEELLEEALPVQWVRDEYGDWEPAPDVLVWVNGVPLEVWLVTASLDELNPDFVDADLLLGTPPEQLPLVLDTDILVLLEDEREERGINLELSVDGTTHSDNAPREFRLARIRRSKVDDMLGWGTTRRGRRWNAGTRWGHSTHSNLKAHEADRVRARRERR
jgi:hypothetical protein